MPKQTASELVQTYWPVVVSVAAAIWATVAFVMKEAPLLAPRADGSGDLTWADTSSPVCRANFAVSIRNTGTTGFAVSKVRVRAWLIDASFSKDDKPTYFDAWGLLGKTKPISDIVYASDTRDGGAVPLPLVAQYYAGMQYNHTFEWDVPRTEQRRFFVIAELFPPNSDAQTDWYFTAWSPVCEPPPPRGSENSSERPNESFRNGAISRTHKDPQLKWSPCPPIFPKGCEVTVLHGDPANGRSDVFLRTPANYRLPPHWHSSPEHMILISGKLHVTYEGQKPSVLRAGSYAYGPAKAKHEARCANAGPCVLFIAFESPIDAVLAEGAPK